MPSCRGINLCVISGQDSKIYPEFPHPDSSQFQYVRSPEPSSQDLDNASASSLQEHIGHKPDDALGANPSISVYIPSLPGTRFFVRYSIDPPHPDGKKFFFKLYMNGRHINSWGVNPRTMPKGQAMRGIFEADKKLRSRATSPNPAETKPFFFNEQKRGISAAENGGLIEVKVFRACGKRRRTPLLDAFRGQDKYGISFRSSGLLEKSNYKYFDWLLEDPKDTPHATFRFHYRSWDSLQALELIPESCTRELLPSTSREGGFRFFDALPKNSSPRTSSTTTDHNSCAAKEDSDSTTSSALGIAVSTNRISTRPIFQTIFGQMVAQDNERSHTRRIAEVNKSTRNSRQPIPDKPQKHYRTPTSSFSVPKQAKLMTWTKSQLNLRPLPELPAGKSLSRKPSGLSTFSVAPSLKSWADGDRSGSPEPVLGVAAEVKVLHSPQLNNYGFGNAKTMHTHGQGDDASTETEEDDEETAYSDAYSSIEPSFVSCLSAPPAGLSTIAPLERSTTAPALGLTLPPEAIFPPPVNSPVRVLLIANPDQEPGYEADRKEGGGSRYSPTPSETEWFSQSPTRLTKSETGYTFGAKRPRPVAIGTGVGWKTESESGDEAEQARRRALDALDGDESPCANKGRGRKMSAMRDIGDDEDEDAEEARKKALAALMGGELGKRRLSFDKEG